MTPKQWLLGIVYLILGGAIWAGAILLWLLLLKATGMLEERWGFVLALLLSFLLMAWFANRFMQPQKKDSS